MTDLWVYFFYDYVEKEMPEAEEEGNMVCGDRCSSGGDLDMDDGL